MALKDVTEADVKREYGEYYGSEEWHAIQQIQKLQRLGLTEREIALVLAITGAVVCNAYCNHPGD